MRVSNLFTKTSKTVPANEVAKNAQLLIQAGFIHKEMAGVYTYLPLGLRVLEKIKSIVREEMNAIGGQELIMTNLQPKEIWEKTTRWDDKVVDIWFKTKLKDDTEVGLAWSHEEPVMEMIRQFVRSYKDLPISIYQFQTKLRNELRAKSGIMRGREFVMKDMYSLHTSTEDLDVYYNKVIEAYKRVYDQLNLGDDTYITFAGGGTFTKFSHEFQTICEAGEDILYLNREEDIAINEEVLEDAIKEFGINKDELEKVKSVEVGNIFNFGAEKARQMDIMFTDSEGKRQPIYLASYGFGITRVMGVIAEQFADDKGLVWPKSVAPFKMYLIGIGDKSSNTTESIYSELTDKGIEVLYDDRDERPGVKFADAELMGIPYRLTISNRLLDTKQYELTERSTGDTKLLTQDELLAKLS
jgi:prolyl-tRNA synthetase